MKRVALLAVLMLAVIAPGCPKQSAVSAPSGIGPDGMSGTLVSSVRQVDVVVSATAIKPEKVYVRKGEQVRLYVTSTDGPHTFVVPRLKVAEKLVPGKVSMIEFTPGGGGDYPFHLADNEKVSGTLTAVP